MPPSLSPFAMFSLHPPSSRLLSFNPFPCLSHPILLVILSPLSSLLSFFLPYLYFLYTLTSIFSFPPSFHLSLPLRYSFSPLILPSHVLLSTPSWPPVLLLRLVRTPFFSLTTSLHDPHSPPPPATEGQIWECT